MFGLPTFLLDPKQRAWIEAEEKRAEERKRARFQSKPAVAWTPTTKWESELYLQAGSWQPPRIFDLPAVPFTSSVQRITDAMSGAIAYSPKETWAYANRTLPAGETLRTCYGSRRGEVMFDGDVTVPVLFDPNDGTVWMSYTPMEAFTLRGGVRTAKGNVLVGGLGLGWQLRMIAAKKSVTRITVVEKSEELLDWYGRRLCVEIAEETKKPIDVVCAEGRDYALNTKGWNAVVFDIWANYGSAAYDTQWQLAKQMHTTSTCSCWAWGSTKT